MIRQKAISVRMYHEVLWRVDQEAMLGNGTRNFIINRGADLLVSTRDLRRRLRMHADMSTRLKILRGYLALNVPEALDLLPD